MMKPEHIHEQAASGGVLGEEVVPSAFSPTLFQYGLALLGAVVIVAAIYGLGELLWLAGVRV